MLSHLITGQIMPFSWLLYCFDFSLLICFCNHSVSINLRSVEHGVCPPSRWRWGSWLRGGMTDQQHPGRQSPWVQLSWPDQDSTTEPEYWEGKIIQNIHNYIKRNTNLTRIGIPDPLTQAIIIEIQVPMNKTLPNTNGCSGSLSKEIVLNNPNMVFIIPFVNVHIVRISISPESSY